VTDQLSVVISRTYEKSGHRQMIFVKQVSGSDVTGTVFRYEVWVDNIEDANKQLTSGNAYAVRRKFVGKLLDLLEDGWKRVGASTSAHPQVKFFDPSEL
jgi:hypothetical protein